MPDNTGNPITNTDTVDIANSDINTSLTSQSSTLKYNTTKVNDTEFDSLVQSTNNDNTVKKLLRANGIYTREELNDFESFHIFPRLDPYKALGTTREYVFFTKPDLHIFNGSDPGTLNPEIAKMPFFKDLQDRGYGPTVLKNLQYSVDQSSPFIKFLSNYKTSNIDLSSITVDENDTAANMYGTKMFYRKASDKSDEESDFSIEFRDNKYLDCYLWFKTFDMYEQKKYQGKITPTNDNYIQNKILYDQMTIFKFIVGENGEDIIHYSAMYGCYPKTVPRETFSDVSGDGNLKFTVQWKCTFQQDLDPMIIKHFNFISKTSSNYNEGDTPIELYDTEIQAITGDDARIPVISIGPVNNSKYLQYKLHWMR